MRIRKNIFGCDTSGGNWTIFVLVFFAVSQLLVYSFNFPRSILYIGDLLNIFVFLNAIRTRAHEQRLTTIPEFILLLFIVVGIISALINTVSPGLLIWGIRNNTRMPIFFVNCVTFLHRRDVYRVLHIIDIMFWLSLPLCFVERFLFQYQPGVIIGDMVGGLFFGFSGCNVPLNIIICFYTIRVVCKYFQGETSFAHFLMSIAAALIMASMAELKVFIPQLVFIFVGVVISLKLQWRSIIKVCVIVASMSITLSYFITVFIALNDNGQSYGDIFTIQGLIEYASRDSGYNGGGDLNRFTGVHTIATTIFKGDPVALLLGIGLGNAEYTNYFFSGFYHNYQILNYQWFHDIWMFIETGAIGLIVFLWFFIDVFVKSKRQTKTESDNALVRTTVILSILLFIYNITLRTEAAGPLIYMVLALPSITNKEMYYNMEESYDS